MTEARYFDEDEREVGLADDAVQIMARRQFAVSLVVAFALLAAAGLAVANGFHAAPYEVAARHKIIRIEAPRIEIAQPALNAMTKG
jgi:hypothetical protein